MIIEREGESENILLESRKGTTVKVQITPVQPKTLTHLPKRPKVDLAFTDLKYTVRQGKASKTILKDVSGRLRSGELTAIMGPSGAGKSTLLNILTGYKTTGMVGSITMNGHERNLSQFRKLSAYIMQDNQLHGNLTVDEAMSVAASLKIGEKTTAERDDIITEILETLGLVDHRRTMTSGLSGGQKKRLSIALELVSNPPIMFFDEPTSGLDSSSCFQCISLLKTLASGGRTIICTIHQPSARLFEMFDHLYTLAEGQCVYQGSTKMLVPFLKTLGLPCPSYHNPASFIIEVSCGEYGDHIKKLVNAIANGQNDIRNENSFPAITPADGLNNATKTVNDLQDVPFIDKSAVNETSNSDVDKLCAKNNSSNGNLLQNVTAVNDIAKDKQNTVVIPVESDKNIDAASASLLEDSLCVPQPRYGTSEVNQFFIILRRTLLFSRRDWTLMYLRLFAHILVGLLIGGLYWNIGNDGAKVLSNLGFLFFNMLFLMYTSMTITILSFPLEMPVLLKENFNRWYSLRSYYLAITISDMPFQTIFCVIYITIVYLMTSQPLEFFRYGMFLGACLLVSFVAQSVGLVVGAAMNVQNGVFLAPVMSVPFLLFSGFFVSFDAIPVYLRWITYLSYIRYGFEGTALATYGFAREKLKCFQIYCHFKFPDTTLEELDMTNSNFTLDIVALILIFFTLRVAAFLFLRWKLKSNRCLTWEISFIIEVSCGEYGDHIKKLVNAIANGQNDIRNENSFPAITPADGLNNATKTVNDLQDVPFIDKSAVNETSNSDVDKLCAKNNSSNGNLLQNVTAVNDIAKDKQNTVVIPVESDKNIDAASASLLEDSLCVPQPRYGTSEVNQFFIILRRTLLFSRRDWTLMYLRLFAHILVGLLIGGLYWNIGNDGAKVLSNLGFLFFNMLFLMYTSMTITILSFPLEMPVLLKENFNRWYSLRSYYLAITISDMPFQTIFCVIYITIVYLMTSQPLEFFRYGMFLGACLLVSFVAQSVGLVVGAAMNVQNGVFLAPVMSVPFLLFSGFFVSFDAIPVYLRWITYLSYIRYGFEGTALATYGFAREKLKCFQIYCHFKFPDTTLEELDMTNSNFTLDIVALILIFFTLRVAAFLFLRWKLKSNR